MEDWQTSITRIPEGFSFGDYQGERYRITKDIMVGGKVSKIFARHQARQDHISFNYYETGDKFWLKPCEMPGQKVIHFLENIKLFYKGVISMLDWNKVLEFSDNGNPAPDRTVRKTDEEWRTALTDEEFRVTRKQGTERAFSSEMCSLFGEGLYSCVCCDTLLFDASEKFESGSGWPSFTQPVKVNAIAYHADRSHGMVRVETVCNTCEAHLGHVFPDGPQPSGLRYCMNAAALKKVEDQLETATFGGGCFWCTEAMFQALKGVSSVESGYTGGQVNDPTYRDVCGGQTGHAEVIQVQFDPSIITYSELLQIHFGTHDPTTLNQQGADKGTQYRSAIFVHSDEQRVAAQQVINDVQQYFSAPITTVVDDLTKFYKAEEYHQDYYRENSEQGYCQAVIDPKLRKLRQLFADKLVV